MSKVYSINRRDIERAKKADKDSALWKLTEYSVHTDKETEVYFCHELRMVGSTVEFIFHGVEPFYVGKDLISPKPNSVTVENVISIARL